MIIVELIGLVIGAVILSFVNSTSDSKISKLNDSIYNKIDKQLKGD